MITANTCRDVANSKCRQAIKLGIKDLYKEIDKYAQNGFYELEVRAPFCCLSDSERMKFRSGFFFLINDYWDEVSKELELKGFKIKKIDSCEFRLLSYVIIWR